MPSSKNMGSPKYKKAPDAPKRFKSAFIIFSAEKHKEIKEKLASQGRVEKVRSRVLACCDASGEAAETLGVRDLLN